MTGILDRDGRAGLSEMVLQRVRIVPGAHKKTNGVVTEVRALR
jgi:hypothetical protein